MYESIRTVREDIHAAGNLSETIPGVPPLGDAALKILEPWITDVVAAYGTDTGPCQRVHACRPPGAPEAQCVVSDLAASRYGE